MTRITLVILTLLVLLAPTPGAAAVVVAPGFQDTLVTGGLVQTSALTFAPDGRLFTVERQLGRVRIYKNGALLAQPFLTVGDLLPAGMTYDTYFERGFLGIAFDPQFATNQWVYLYFSVCKVAGNPCITARNRVVRVTAVGDVADVASQVVVLDDIENDAGNHLGGWIEFGPTDGKLYVSVGDGGGVPTKAQDMNNLCGKILRLNADGTIPADNPFVGHPGKRSEIWAAGFRNPYRCRFAPDARLFCGEVGLNTWEELNVVTRAANYGWPQTEGPFDAATYPQFTAPIHAYHHNGSRACIIGGDFGSRTTFPGDAQSYFFADFVLGTISRARLDAAGTAVQSVEPFVSGIGDNGVTNLVAGPDGSLYYTNYNAAQIRRITAITNNASPLAQISANPASGLPPLTVQLSSAGSSDPDGDALTYSWSFGDGTATSALPSPTHQYEAAGRYVATLTVSDGKALPGPATTSVTIVVGNPPVVTIAQPTDGAAFRAGDAIALAGSATDREDGTLAPAALRWEVIFHHDDHVHPFLDDLPGSTPSFATAASGETDPDVGYEVILHATDSHGLTASESLFVLPELADFTLTTEPPGLPLTFDGAPVSTPLTLTGVVGFHRTIGANASVTSGGQTHWFSRWSDNGARTHTIDTPSGGGTFTARFRPDTCAAPFVIPADGGTFELATGGASAESASCGPGSSPEQVVRWTPAVSGTATIATCGGSTAYDTVLYVRSGSCASGSTLACGDDSPGCGTTEPNDHHGSLLTLSVTAGQTYFIVVDGYGGAAGAVTLTVTPPSSASPSPTLAATPTATRTTTPTLLPTATATPVPATATRTSTPVAATPTRTTTPLPAATATAAASPASACTAPTVVPAPGGVFTGVTSGTSSLSATCAATGNSPEAVFQWTPATAGLATIATCGGTTSFDTVVFMRSGLCSTGPSVGCADDAAGCGTTEPNDHHASRLQVTVTAGQTYFIVVDGYNGARGAFTLTITPPPAASPIAATATPTRTATATPTPVATAAAGTCVSPIVVPPAGGTLGGTTAGASAESGSCGLSDKSAERVFVWTPAVSGTATIGTCGTATLYDTVLYLRGATCGGELGCSDDVNGCNTGEPNEYHGSRLTTAVTAGQTYFIVVDGYNGGAGPFSLTVTAPTAATVTPTRTVTPSPAATVTAAPTATRTATPLPTVTATPAATPTATVTTAPTGTATRTPTPLPTATSAPGGCGNPIVVPAGGGFVTGVTGTASAQSGSCAITDKSGEQVFQWTPAVSGAATIATCGTATRYDTVLYLRSGTCGAAEVGCSDDVAGCNTGEPNEYHGSRLTTAVTAGQSYFIVVDGYNGAAGTFGLTVTAPGAATPTRTATPAASAMPVASATPVQTAAPTSTVTATRTPTPTPSATPPPGVCANPIVVPPGGGTVSGTTSGTSAEVGSCGVSHKSPEQVFAWTPTASGTATVGTCGAATLFDTVLYMRSGTCGGSELGCSDDVTGCATGEPNDYHGSRLTVSVTAGQTYYFVVDGYNGAAGAFALTVVAPGS